MLALLSTVKNRLGLLETEITYDALLAATIQVVSQRFDFETNRTLARTENLRQEFEAHAIEICAACYPIETVTSFELKTSEIEGWVEQALPRHIIRQRCVISLQAPLGALWQQARVTYTGGFVVPGATPAPGQEPLPAMIEQAAVEQVAFWFQNRDRLGLSRMWEYHGTYRDIAELDLLQSVRLALFHFTRWER